MGYRHIHPNQLKYLHPPTYEQIMKVVKAHGVPAKQFERFYGMFDCTIYRTNPNAKPHQPLATKHWHIIYESLERIEKNQSVVVPRRSSFIKSHFPKKKIKRPQKPRTPAVQRTGIIAELL